jgi:hypothetical protein
MVCILCLAHTVIPGYCFLHLQPDSQILLYSTLMTLNGISTLITLLITQSSSGDESSAARENITDTTSIKETSSYVALYTVRASTPTGKSLFIRL